MEIISLHVIIKKLLYLITVACKLVQVKVDMGVQVRNPFA